MLADLAIECHGHSFRIYGEEERLCRKCGFVLWLTKDFAATEAALRKTGGGTCPGVWHGKQGRLPSRRVKQ